MRRSEAVAAPEAGSADGGNRPGQASLEVSAESSALDLPLFAHYSRRSFLMTVRRSQESIYREILTAALTGDEPTLEEIAGSIARLPKEETGDIAELRQHLRQLCNLGAEVCDHLEESGLGGAAGSLDADPAFVLVNEVLHHHYGGPSLQELEEVDDVLSEPEGAWKASPRADHDEAGDFEAPQERPLRASRQPEKDQTQSPHMRVKSQERAPEWAEAMPDTGPSPWMGLNLGGDLGGDLEDAPSEHSFAQQPPGRGMARNPNASGLATNPEQVKSAPGAPSGVPRTSPTAAPTPEADLDEGEDLDLDPPSVLTDTSVLANALQEVHEAAHPRRQSPDYGERPTEEFANPGILKGLRDRKNAADPSADDSKPPATPRAATPAPRPARAAQTSHAATWEHGAVPIPSSWRDDFESELSSDLASDLSSELSEEWEHAASTALDAAWPGETPAQEPSPENLAPTTPAISAPPSANVGTQAAAKGAPSAPGRAAVESPPAPSAPAAAALIELVEEPEAESDTPLEALQAMDESDADTLELAPAAPAARGPVPLEAGPSAPQRPEKGRQEASLPNPTISLVESPPPTSFLLELLDQLGALDDPDMEAWMNFMQGPVFHPDHDQEPGVLGMRRLTSFLWEQVTEGQKARERMATAESRMARVQRLENERQQNEAYLERVDVTLSQVERLVDQLFYAEPIAWHALSEDDFPVRPSLLSSLLRLGETVETWRQGSDDAHKNQEEHDLELEDLKELLEDKERFISVQDRQLLDREDRIVELQRGIERKNAELAKLKVLSLYNHLRFSVLDLRRRIDGALAPKGLLGRRKLPPPDQMKLLIADHQQIEKLLETLKDRVEAEELKPLEEDLSWLRRYAAAFRKVLGVAAEPIPAASQGKKGAHGASADKHADKKDSASHAEEVPAPHESAAAPAADSTPHAHADSTASAGAEHAPDSTDSAASSANHQSSTEQS